MACARDGGLPCIGSWATVTRHRMASAGGGLPSGCRISLVSQLMVLLLGDSLFLCALQMSCPEVRVALTDWLVCWRSASLFTAASNTQPSGHWCYCSLCWLASGLVLWDVPTGAKVLMKSLTVIHHQLFYSLKNKRSLNNHLPCARLLKTNWTEQHMKSRNKVRACAYFSGPLPSSSIYTCCGKCLLHPSDLCHKNNDEVTVHMRVNVLLMI